MKLVYGLCLGCGFERCEVRHLKPYLEGRLISFSNHGFIDRFKLTPIRKASVKAAEISLSS